MTLRNTLGKLMTQTHTAVYRASKGKIAGSMGEQKVVLLTTTGRKSGQKRTSPLVSFPEGDDLVIIASNGGAENFPAWYHNLTANPDVEIQIGDEVTPMRARTASAEERSRIWPQITAKAKNFANYQKKTSRIIPVVVLSPR